ncbi:MAG: hypothetical protein K0Q72_1218 [Armatimonadetes bacterium]|jgi:uncharacterized membrane protein YdcZ (DUF606 family)|nr:hypothetical protein [Armatimonadota bacterium]
MPIENPRYLRAASYGKWLGRLWVVADVSYYLGLLGGLIGVLAVVTRLPFDLLQGRSAPWWWYVGGVLGTLLLAGVLILFAIGLNEWIERRIQALDEQPHSSSTWKR